MSDDSAEIDIALFDFRARYAADAALGALASAESYARRFPGFEAHIMAAYAGLQRGEPFDPVTVATVQASAKAAERMIAHYRLMRELGRGGQGSVHLAEDTRLHRRVAIKLLAGLSQFSAEARRRFQREAETASRLDHPGICTVYESGIDQGIAYIAMRYIDGDSLSARIAGERARRSVWPAGPSSNVRRWRVRSRAPAASSSGRGSGARVAGASAAVSGASRDAESPNANSEPAPARTGAENLDARYPCAPDSRDELVACLRFFEAAARTLHVAHEAGIIHRDVKPGNLMIAAIRTPIILDFGLARDLAPGTESITQSVDVRGTPAYMSPEQLEPKGRTLDARTDVYSLGATLYECLTLELPFQAPTVSELEQRILRHPPRDARTINRSIPNDLAIVLETALEKDRDRRYRTALEFAEELRRICEREPIHARAPGVWLRALRWIQRSPAQAVGLAGASLLAAVLVFTIVLARINGELEQQNADDALQGRVLDSLSESRTRGTFHDWAADASQSVRLFEEYDIPLGDDTGEQDVVEAIEAVRSRNPELAGDLVDTLYRTAWTISDGARRCSSSPDAPEDLRSEALQQAPWRTLQPRLESLIRKLDASRSRRAIWERYHAWLEGGPDELDTFTHDLDSIADARELLFLSEILYLVRRDGSALPVLDAAASRTSQSAALRYAIRINRGIIRAATGDDEGAASDLDTAREIQPQCAATYLWLSEIGDRRGNSDDALRWARLAVEHGRDLARAYTLLASLLVKSKNPSEALGPAARAVELAPHDPRAAELLATAHAFDKRWRAAFEAWNDAARLTKSPADVWRRAGRVLFDADRDIAVLETVQELVGSNVLAAELCCAWADAALSAKCSDLATTAITRAESLATRDPAIHGIVARAWERAGKNDRALTNDLATVAIDASSARAWCDLARVQQAARQRNEARASLARALECDHGDPRLEQDLARIADDLQDLELACNLMRTSVAGPGADAARWTYFGMLQSAVAERNDWRGGAADEVCTSFLRAIELDPLYEPAIRQLRLSLSHSSRPADIKAKLDTIQQTHPNAVRLREPRAAAALVLRDVEQAIALLTEASELDPASASALCRLAELHSTRGDLGASIDCATGALRRNPRANDTRRLRAIALLRVGEWHGAADDFEFLVRNEPRDAGALSHFTDTAFGVGEFARVAALARKLLGATPDHRLARKVLIEALRAMGEFGEAREELDAWLQLLPTDPDAQLQKAKLLSDLGQWASASAAYDQLVPKARERADVIDDQRLVTRRSTAGEIPRRDSPDASSALEAAVDLFDDGHFVEAAERMARELELGTRTGGAASDGFVEAELWCRAIEEELRERESRNAAGDGVVELRSEESVDVAGLPWRLRCIRALTRWVDATTQEGMHDRDSAAAAIRSLRRVFVDRDLLALRLARPDTSWGSEAAAVLANVRQSVSWLYRRHRLD